jgi:RNA polymerase sigma-70 factor (ECF subfamily)
MSDSGNAPARLAFEGGATALTDLYLNHFSALCAYVRKKFGMGPPDPEDAAQAAFAQFAALKNPERIENPRAFLFTCASNFVLDHRRRQSVSSRAAIDLLTLKSIDIPAVADPSRVLEGREALAAVASAIRSLDARRRDVLLMHSIDGLSCAEIARRMHLSPTRVIQLYADAIRICQQARHQADGDPIA